MKKETNVFMALIKHDPHFLERPLKDLLPMRCMGEVFVASYRALMKRVDDLPLSLEEKQSRLKDGQDAGKALLMIEVKIGELLKAIPSSPLQEKSGKLLGSKKRLPAGINYKTAERAQRIASHPAEVAEVIREAEENEDIPTKTAVLNKITYKRELERTKGTREKTQIEMAADAYLYYSRLMDALALIPASPPRELREKDFIRIKAVALSIIQKLKEFTNEKTEVFARPIQRLSAGK